MKHWVYLFCALVVSIAGFGQTQVSPALPEHDTLIELGDKELYIAFPEPGRCPVDVVFALHGSGRQARSYRDGDPASSAFYCYQKELALEAGCLFAVVSNGTDTWGTKAGLATVAAAYTYIRRHYNVKSQWTFWATSAGGALLSRILMEKPAMVKKAVGTFPVYDMDDSYKRLASARNTWDALKTEERMYDPKEHPEVFSGVPYLIFHGRADVAVPVERHSAQLFETLKRAGKQKDLKLYIVDGGHHTSNWAVYDKKRILKFIKDR